MKVCFIVGTLGRGGAEKQLMFMLRALQNVGAETRVLCLTKNEPYESDIRSMGIEVEYVGENQNRFIRALKIIRNIRNRPVDIVQSSHFYTNIYAALAGRILKIPSVGAIRSNLTGGFEFSGFLSRFQLRMPHFLMTNSDVSRRNAIEQGIAPERIEFVRNVVEIQSNTTEIPAGDQRDIVFLFVGRLSREKRADRFIRLALALVKEFPDLPMRFQIAGDGILRADLERQVRDSASPKDKIEFLGECSSMGEIYRNADILVLTSDFEGTPNAVLEAMAHGMPVIATNVGGVSGILNEQHGYLVEPNDERSMVKAAADLLQNPALRFRLGCEGLRFVNSNHSFDNLSSHLISIYKRLNGKIEFQQVLNQGTDQELSKR